MYNGRQVKLGVTYPHWSNDREDWVTVENAHPAIIDKEYWLHISNLNAETKLKKSNQHIHRSEYLLTGLIRCSLCGFSFQGTTVKSKDHTYSRYLDSGWENKRVCPYFALPKQKLEQFAINAVKETLAEARAQDRIQHFLDLLMEEHPN